MYGADVAQLRQAAAQFDRHAQQLDAGRMTVGNVIKISAWVGPFATSFRVQWDSEHSRRVHDAAMRLRDAAQKLRANADEQERASAAGSGGSTGHSSEGASHAPSKVQSKLADKWDAMSDAEKRALPLLQLASVYGYAPLLPARIRDEANRLALERYMNVPCPAGPRSAVEEYQRHMRAYQQIKQTFAAHPDTQLLVLDPDAGGSVHVAIALGDVDHADRVSVYTQGWTSSADKENGLLHPVQEMSDLRAATERSLRARGSSDSTATVVWMDYEAPQQEPHFGDLFGIASAQMPQYAEAGSVRLAEFAQGIRANNPSAYITGLGHSYGSYVTGLAAQQTQAFDQLIVFGSPGVGASNADQLNVGGNFYVLEGGLDLIADSAQFGIDPSKMAGAHNVAVDSLGGHTDYLTSGGQGQRAIAQLLASNR